MCVCCEWLARTTHKQQQFVIPAFLQSRQKKKKERKKKVPITGSRQAQSATSNAADSPATHYHQQRNTAVPIIENMPPNFDTQGGKEMTGFHI